MKRRTLLLAVGVLLVLSGSPARAAELEIGQAAPDFALPDETGRVRHLADYRGRNVVLMFYPKDFTPG
jgi:peroxiredoxin Q/BCP